MVASIMKTGSPCHGETEKKEVLKLTRPCRNYKGNVNKRSFLLLELPGLFFDKRCKIPLNILYTEGKIQVKDYLFFLLNICQRVIIAKNFLIVQKMLL